MLTGSIVALVTPMHESGEVAWDALDELIEWHVESGTHGIVPMGTTGESATLDTEEHLQVIKRTIDQVAGRMPPCCWDDHYFTWTLQASMHAFSDELLNLLFALPACGVAWPLFHRLVVRCDVP